MHKTLLIARRDYVATVRTKAFLIGLLVPPLLFGGSILATFFLKGNGGKEVSRIAILDQTGIVGAGIIEQANREMAGQSFPKHEFILVTPDSRKPDEQRLALSDQVRKKALFAFMEVGPQSVNWYSNEGGFGETERWIAGPVNDALRRIRLTSLGVSRKQLDEALRPVAVVNLSLVARDLRSGRIVPARKLGIGEGFVVPFALAFLFFMIVLPTSAPLMAAVAEDKMQRVFEMLLTSASPSNLIGGKVLAAIGSALTTSVLYVAGAVLLLQALAILGLAPLFIIPWFLVYLIAEVTMLSSLATAVGAACGSTRDAENLKLLLIAPIMIPLLFLTPVLQQPNGTFATLMSLFPLFTPILMLVRQATPGGVPWWQPLLGLAGAALATLLISWMASRIFRIGILLQGKSPTLAELFRWGISG